MNKITTAIMVLFFSLNTYAKVEVLFHPYDDTMSKISEHFQAASESIDMALYNIDDKKSNPVIKAIQSEAIQSKIKSGELKIRLLFEGYMSKDENKQKMVNLEAMGVDVKYLGIGKKMHHKFATIDAYTSSPVLITGSANWSMMSQRNYNENTLFFQDQPGITLNFQKEFELLWGEAKEIGQKNTYKSLLSDYDKSLESGISVDFNTDNFKLTDRGFRKSKDTSYVLTKEIVAAIDRAQRRVRIATTRLKLRPVYEAILRAADRGVQVQIIVTQGEYLPLFVNKKMKACQNIFDKKCSTSQNFAQFLIKEDYVGKDNVEVRVKLFDLRRDNLINIAKQMHSKYMIVDDEEVLTGSFNWSYSAEYNHFENLVKMEASYFDVLDSFLGDFEYMWDMGREEYDSVYDRLTGESKFKCRFAPMALTFSEVDQLVRKAKQKKRCQTVRRSK